MSTSASTGSGSTKRTKVDLTLRVAVPAPNTTGFLTRICGLPSHRQTHLASFFRVTDWALLVHLSRADHYLLPQSLLAARKGFEFFKGMELLLVLRHWPVGNPISPEFAVGLQNIFRDLTAPFAGEENAPYRWGVRVSIMDTFKRVDMGLLLPSLSSRVRFDPSALVCSLHARLDRTPEGQLAIYRSRHAIAPSYFPQVFQALVPPHQPLSPFFPRGTAVDLVIAQKGPLENSSLEPLVERLVRFPWECGILATENFFNDKSSEEIGKALIIVVEAAKQVTYLRPLVLHILNRGLASANMSPAKIGECLFKLSEEAQTTPSLKLLLPEILRAGYGAIIAGIRNPDFAELIKSKEGFQQAWKEMETLFTHISAVDNICCEYIVDNQYVDSCWETIRGEVGDYFYDIPEALIACSEEGAHLAVDILSDNALCYCADSVAEALVEEEGPLKERYLRVEWMKAQAALRQELRDGTLFHA